MSPESHGEDYYVALVHLQLPEWSHGSFACPEKTLRMILRRSRDEYALSIAYSYLGEIYELCGEIERSIEHHEKSMSYSFHRGIIGNGLNCLGLLYFNLGLFDRAGACYREANDTAGHLLASIFSKIGVARCEMRDGRIERSRRWLACAEALIQRYRTMMIVDQEVQLIVGMGELQARSGDIASAVETFARGEFIANAAKRTRYLLRVLEAHAQVLVDARHPGASAAVRRYLIQAQGVGMRQSVDRARRLEAQLARQLGASPDELLDLCDRIQDPGQRFIAMSPLLREVEFASVELSRLGGTMPSDVAAAMFETHAEVA